MITKKLNNQYHWESRKSKFVEFILIDEVVDRGDNQNVLHVLSLCNIIRRSVNIDITIFY